MDNTATNNREREKNELYDVSNLYLLTTERKTVADFETTRYILEDFVGIKREDKYYEFFSNTELNMEKDGEPSEFDKLFISKVKPLSEYIQSSTISKQDIFAYLIKINSCNRSVLDIIK
ncbi:hypothetical protein [Methanobrevibacter sp.]